MGLLTGIKNYFSGSTVKGSAFTKVNATDAQEAEAKGRVSAIDAYTKAKHEVADFLEKEVERVHTELGSVKSRLDGVLSKL